MTLVKATAITIAANIVQRGSRRHTFANTGAGIALSVVTLSFITLLCVACSRSPEQHAQSLTSGAQASRVLLRGIGPEPDSMDPQKALSTEAQDVLRDLCEGLTSLGHDASVVPGVAQEWTISSDRLTYEFHLRPNARWSNGDPVVADDFVAGFRRLLDPATASSYAQVLDVIVNARSILS